MPTSNRGTGTPRKRKLAPPPAPISEHAMQARATRRPPSPIDKQATVYAAPRSVFIPPPPPGPPLSEHTPQMQPRMPPSRPAKPATKREYRLALGRPVRVDVQHQPRNVADLVPPPPSPRRGAVGGFLHRLGESERQHLGQTARAARVAGQVAVAPLEDLANTAIRAAYEPQGQSPLTRRITPPPAARAATEGAYAATHGAAVAALGPNLGRVALGQSPTSTRGLLLDTALLLPGTKATRIVRGAVEAEIAARGLRGAERTMAVEKAWQNVMEGDNLARQTIDRARKSSVLRGPARDDAHGLIDQTVTDPVNRKVAKQQFDGHVYEAVKNLPAKQRRDAASAIYHQLSDAVRSAPEHAVPGFKPVVNDVKGQANLRQAIKAHEMFPEVGIRSQNPAHFSTNPETNGLQVVGEIQPQPYMDRLNVAVGGNIELGLRLASWYREAMPILHTFFGEDAPAIMRGFAVSQANASPSGGLQAVLTIRDLLLRGESIPRKPNGTALISTVADSIQKAVEGQEVSKGLAAKLHDFAASLEGKRARTWTLDDIRGGAPVAVDIHALRDVGLVDPKILATLRDRHGIDVSGLKLDNPDSAAQGLQYELVAEKYRQLTQAMNDAKFWGKDNWTPADVQALGWSAIQRIHGTFPEDLMFAVDRNTYDMAAEVLHGRTGMGQGLSLAAQKAVTEEITQAFLPRIVQDENAFVRDLTVGPAAWENNQSVAANMKIVGSPAQADRIAQRLANMFDQYDVWAVRRNVSGGRVGFEVRSESFDNTDMVDRFWQALKRNTPKNLQKHLEGFTPIEIGDMKGIRVITQSPGQVYRELPAYMEKNWEQAILKSADEAGLRGKTRYTAVNVELRKSSTAADRARTSYGSTVRAGQSGGVGDPIADEARAALLASIDKHSGLAGRARRGAAALASERGELNLGAFLSRWSKPDITHAVLEPTPSREELIAATADQVKAWQRANPHADDMLVSDMIKTIAEHNGVDEYGLERYLASGKIPIGETEDATALGEIRRIATTSGRVRRRQDAERAAAWAERAAMSNLEYERAGQGVGGHYASLRALKGELPALHFGNFSSFSDEAINSLFAHIQGHPDLRTFERIRARNAILRVLVGSVPQKNEVKLLGQIFGRDTAKEIVASVPWHAKLHQRALEVWNLPRALMATFDMSAPFRQGLVTSTRHPRLFARNFKLMVRAFGHEKVYDAMMNEIVSMPRYDDMVRDGLSLTDLEHLNSREEAMLGGQLGERIPVLGSGKVGKYELHYVPSVRASGRAYTGFLNKMRADMYNLLADKAEEAGIDLTATSRARMAKGFSSGEAEKETVGEALARYINSATGRGDLGSMQKHATTLSSILFSPRLLASRINFISPVYYAKLDPFARKEAIRSFASLMGAVSAFLYVAHMGGAKVGLDPRNADFGKIKMGKTRLDILGGFQQPVRFLSQFFSGTIVSSTTGKKMSLASSKYGALTRMDVLQRFIRSKTAPFPSVFWDLTANSTFIGDPITLQNEFLSHTIPLAAQDSYDMYTQTGHWPLILGSYGASGIGFGVQTYGTKKPAVKRKHLSQTGGNGIPGLSGGSSSIPGLGGGGSVPGLP